MASPADADANLKRALEQLNENEAAVAEAINEARAEHARSDPPLTGSALLERSSDQIAENYVQADHARPRISELLMWHGGEPDTEVFPGGSDELLRYAFWEFRQEVAWPGPNESDITNGRLLKALKRIFLRFLRQSSMKLRDAAPSEA